MIILGIDPGLTGGCVFLHQDTDIVDTMEGCDPYELTAKLKTNLKIAEIHAFVERSQAFPKNGCVQSFTYGSVYGSILGVLAALEITYTLVPPPTWTKEMLAGISRVRYRKSKERCYQAFKQLFPSVNFKASPRCKNHHQGLVDALLIAEYGRRQLARDSHVRIG